MMAAKHKNIEPKSTKQQAYCGGKFEEVFSPIVKLMKMYLLGKVKAAGRLQFSFLINFTIFILGYSYLFFNSGLRHLHKFLKIRNLKANFFDRNDYQQNQVSRCRPVPRQRRRVTLPVQEGPFSLKVQKIRWN